MMVYYHKCDHCGKELNEMHDYVDSEIDMDMCRVEADLCEECAEKLKNMITYFLNKKDK